MKKQWGFFLLLGIVAFGNLFSFVQSDWFSQKTRDDYSSLASLVENKVVREIVKSEKVHPVIIYLQLIEEAENTLVDHASYSDALYDALMRCYEDTYQEFLLRYDVRIPLEQPRSVKTITDHLCNYAQGSYNASQKTNYPFKKALIFFLLTLEKINMQEQAGYEGEQHSLEQKEQFLKDAFYYFKQTYEGVTKQSHDSTLIPYDTIEEALTTLKGIVLPQVAFEEQVEQNPTLNFWVSCKAAWSYVMGLPATKSYTFWFLLFIFLGFFLLIGMRITSENIWKWFFKKNDFNPEGSILIKEEANEKPLDKGAGQGMIAHEVIENAVSNLRVSAAKRSHKKDGILINMTIIKRRGSQPLTTVSENKAAPKKQRRGKNSKSRNK